MSWFGIWTVPISTCRSCSNTGRYWKIFNWSDQTVWTVVMAYGTWNRYVFGIFVLLDRWCFCLFDVVVPCRKNGLCISIFDYFASVLRRTVICLFVSHFKDLKDHAILCGSLVYLFNAYLLYSNVAQPFFTLPFIIFPLIITAIEKVLQDGSFGRFIWSFHGCWSAIFILRTSWGLAQWFIWLCVG